MDLGQALETSLQVLDILNSKKQELDKLLEKNKYIANALNVREEALNTREVALGKLEDAKAMLEKVQGIRAEIEDERKALEEGKTVFYNDMNARKAELSKEEDALLAVMEQADQVRKDKIALEAEKKVYKAKIEKELMDKLKVK